MASASGNNPDVSVTLMEDDLSCNICYNLLREPKDLDCPHVFCLQCLQKWVKNKPTVECPECHHITSVPHGGLVNLKTNLRLKSMVDKYAEHVEKHKSVPMCPNHEGEKQHFFCVTCGVTVCHDCLVSQHPISQHEIKELTVIVTTQKTEMKAKMGNVEQEMKRIEGDAKKLEEMERQLQAARSKAEHDVKKRVRVAMFEVEAKGKEMIASIQASYRQHMKTLSEKRHETNDMVTRLRNVHTATQNVVDTAADHIYMKQHSLLVDKVDTLCESISQYEIQSPDLANLQFNPGSGTVNSSWFGDLAANDTRLHELKLTAEFGAFQQAQGIAVTKTGVLAVVDFTAKEVRIHRLVNGEYKPQFSLDSSAHSPGKIYEAI
ncbi:E3 ubiquitin-protein ligase TRIM65-like [Amphiura filiformis]|uniref:E3 ubiquitin-protein ligase TRIM65-like n=1 Tax=Amphiura filiformis TaxID=82378 RepID=UPI003B21BF46